MSKLILMVGITASGKSTYAKTHMAEDDVLVSRDEIRRVLYNGVDNFYNHEFIVTPVYIYEIVKALKENKTVWFEAINGTPDFRNRILCQIEEYIIADELETIYMDTPFEIAIQRNIERGGPTQLSVAAVKDFYNNLIPPTIEEFINRGYKEITVTTIKNNG